MSSVPTSDVTGEVGELSERPHRWVHHLALSMTESQVRRFLEEGRVSLPRLAEAEPVVAFENGPICLDCELPVTDAIGTPCLGSPGRVTVTDRFGRIQSMFPLNGMFSKLPDQRERECIRRVPTG